MQMRLEGGKALDRILGELPKTVARRELREIGKIVLDPMASMASALAPDRSGKLAFSISVSEGRTRRAKSDFKFDRINGVQIAMGPAGGTGALNYASFAEFGTIDTVAKPYMRPTWDALASSSLNDIGSLMWSRISKASERNAKRLAKKAA